MGLMISAKRKVAMEMAPVHKYQPGNPSLNKTKIKDKKIMALPVSGCNKINKTGSPIIANAIY